MQEPLTIMTDEEEASLIAKAAKGDPDSFSCLVKKYERFVYNIAIQSLGNADDAFDVSQEVFLKAYRALSKFRSDCRFSTWLYRITVNTVRDHMRAGSRRKTVSLSEYGDDGEENGTVDLPDDRVESHPDESTERKEQQEMVRRAIASLSEDHQRIVIMREIEGLSYEAIAEALDISIGTVKSRINRARLAIRDYLVNKEGFTGL